MTPSAARLLDCLRETGHACTLQELCKKTGMPWSTVRVCCMALLDENLIRREKGSWPHAYKAVTSVTTVAVTSDEITARSEDEGRPFAALTETKDEKDEIDQTDQTDEMDEPDEKPVLPPAPDDEVRQYALHVVKGSAADEREPRTVREEKEQLIEELELEQLALATRIALLADRGAQILAEIDRCKERMALVTSKVAHLTGDNTAPSSLLDVQREHIQAALDAHRGNKSAAARAVGITRRSFLRRIDKLGIERDRKATQGGE